MGREELLEDQRFNSNNQRVLNNKELKPLVEEWTYKHTIDEIVETLLDKGVPASPVNTIDRVVSDPHIAGAREMFVEIDHPKAGKLTMTGNHLKFTNNKIEKFEPAPILGQHTEEILKEVLKYTDEEIADMKGKKVF